jgi:hypothetical protein
MQWLHKLRKAGLTELVGSGTWHGWSDEVDYDIDDSKVKDCINSYVVSPTVSYT